MGVVYNCSFLCPMWAFNSKMLTRSFLWKKLILFLSQRILDLGHDPDCEVLIDRLTYCDTFSEKIVLICIFAIQRDECFSLILLMLILCACQTVRCKNGGWLHWQERSDGSALCRLHWKRSGKNNSYFVTAQSKQNNVYLLCVRYIYIQRYQVISIA